MSDQKNPLEAAVEQAVDAFVYAPIGFWLDGPAALPKMIKNGRNQVTNARVMGQFAVQAGQTELQKRASSLEGPVADLLRGLGVIEPKPKVAEAPAPEPAREAAPAPAQKATSKKSPSKKAPAKKAAAKKAAKTRGVKVPSAGSLPIPDYDSLSASQVVGRLGGLATRELEAVRAYEAAKRARKTILNKVSQLQK